MSTHCVQWRSLRNKVSLSYTDLSNADTFYYTVYKKCRHAPLLVSPQPPFNMGTESPQAAMHSERLLPVPVPGSRNSTEQPLPCHCLHFPWKLPGGSHNEQLLLLQPPCVPWPWRTLALSSTCCLHTHPHHQMRFAQSPAWTWGWPTACTATPDQLQPDQTSKHLCYLMS